MTGPTTGDITPTAAATPAPRPATAGPGGAALPTTPPAGATVSTRPTASPSQAGHNPNVIIPRSQMTPGQRRALDRHNAAEVEKRDAAVAAYLKSVLPSEDEETPAPERTPTAEAATETDPFPHLSDEDAEATRERQTSDGEHFAREEERRATEQRDRMERVRRESEQVTNPTPNAES